MIMIFPSRGKKTRYNQPYLNISVGTDNIPSFQNKKTESI